MTDRALLEAAARAAGMTLKTDEDGKLRASPDGHWWPVWNPLESDGDALRLAVRLRLDIEWTRDERDRAVASKPNRVAWGENSGSDPYAATRRAIVRAAAAMVDGGE